MSGAGVTPTIGVCEDDDELRGILRDALQREGMTVRPTASGAEAVRMFAGDAPDVLVLDIGLPDADGRDVCQALRARGVTSPVLFLTARDAVPDRISGFHAGGDDYLTKPFALAELVARLKALAKRTSVEAGTGELRLDPVSHAVGGPGEHADQAQQREHDGAGSIASGGEYGEALDDDERERGVDRRTVEELVAERLVGDEQRQACREAAALH